MNTPASYAKYLADTLTKITMTIFFKEIHTRFYSEYDISFMDFFLEIIDKDGEFCIEHYKLVEYGVLTSSESSDIRKKLNRHNMKEYVDFTIGTRSVRGKSGSTTKKVYYLTPDAFKKCLMNTQKHPSQKIDPEIYSDYFLLLEKVYKYYSNYEKMYSNKIIEQKDDKIDEQTKKIDKLQSELSEVLANTRFIINQNVDLNDKVVQISSKMDTMMNLYIRDGNGFMIFQKIITDHDGNFTADATNIEKRLYPGLARLKALFLCAYYKEGVVHVYSICRNFSSSLKTRIKELEKRYVGWRKLMPVGISLVYTEVNIELTFLEKNSFWENGEYDKDKNCYVFNYDITLERSEILSYIRAGFALAANCKINNYQKNIYEYDIGNEHDGVIISDLITQDTGFHNESRDLISNVIKSVVLCDNTKVVRPDIIIDGRRVLLSDKHYYLTKLYQFLKSQNTPAIVEEFKNRI